MIHSKLEETRRTLLDLTRRNRLLNFRPEAAGVIRVVGESPAHAYRALVESQKTLQFLAAEEAASGRMGPEGDGPGCEAGVAPEAEGPSLSLADLDPGATAAERLTDLCLQTPHRGPELQRRLLNLARQAESAMQEQGANILYLAIGLVEWTDRLDSKVRSLAPVLLLPVELVRRSVRRRHSVRMLDEEAVVNPVFAELCRAQFGLRVPEFDPEAAGPVEACLSAVGAAIRPLRSWALRPDIHLALLSFSKLLMYLDLDDARWSAPARVSEHPQVLSLLGLASAWPRPERPPEAASLDDTVAPQETFQVLDADSSQQAAIIAAKGGASLVIQGPPGTGKSQTITNIIAECLSQGKTVLFVAEKAAALDVVLRRLDQVGLGAFAAPLHSRKASKRAFMEDLARTLAFDPRPQHARQRLNPEDLARLRADLNLYVRALHRPVAPLGVTTFEAIGRALALGAAPEAPVAIEEPLAWDASRLARARDALAACASATRKAGDPSSHPWRGVDTDTLPLAKRQQAERAVRAMLHAVATAQKAAARLAASLGARPPACPLDAAALAGAVGAAMRAPPIPAGSLAGPAWDAAPAGLPALVGAGRRLEEIRDEVGGRWTPDAEGRDWSAAAATYARLGGSGLRWLAPAWWRARAQVRSAAAPGAARVTTQRTNGDLALLVEAASLRGVVAEATPWAAPLFGPIWGADRSDWDRLSHYAEAAVALRALVRAGQASESNLSALGDPLRRNATGAAAEEARRALARLASDARDLVAALSIDVPAFFGADVERSPFGSLDARLRECLGAAEALVDRVERTRARRDCEAAGLAAFLGWADANPAVRPEEWTNAFLRQFHRLWADAAVADAEPLAGFRAEEHERSVGVFRQLDREWLEDTRRRLVAGVAAARPRVGHSIAETSGLGILEAQLRRQRNIMPIRRLLASPAGDAILRIKPCFMMSPLSVAQHLEPGRLRFDVVIFDEASQVEPADALGAVARAGQLVLVGDEKQLPPTRFFAALAGEPSDAVGAAESEFDIPVSDLESVLSLGWASLPVRTSLRWHYRSRHQSLIDFSNREFYDGSLRVFPSPAATPADLGLSFAHVPEGVYLRARGQHNPVEAGRVAQAVLEHARKGPGVSLGVGAFSVAQQRAIEDELERARREGEDAALDAFFDPSREEPFFVKNLETIQGDERDAMLLSVGYGPDENGRLTMNFGPVNQEGGWRRLNVLATRARLRCTVFSSITAEQVRIDPDTPRGVRALRAYLAYAAACTPRPESGESAAGGTEDSRGLADFDSVLAAHLRDAGYEVRLQVGTAGFGIDLAVLDPRDPSRYLAGIETDGATYHACPTARDRDRLRQDVLERLGWTILRVWAPEWFSQPERSLKALLAQLAELADGRAPPAPPFAATGPQADPDPQRVESQAPLPAGISSYALYASRGRGDRDALLRARLDTLASIVGDIVAVEGPIQRDEAVRIAAGLFDARVAGQAADRLAEAVAAATAGNLAVARGEFLWPPDMERPPIRCRSTPGGRAGGPGFYAEASSRPVCPEEMLEAVTWVAEHEFGVPLDDLAAAAVRRLGFRRTTRTLEALAREAVETALGSRRITAGPDGFVRAAAAEG